MRKKKLVKLVTLDTETYDGLVGGLKRIAIYDGERVSYGYQFSDIEPILIGFFNEGYDVHIYIHNLEFDARKIPEIFDRDRIDWGKCMLISNKFAKITTKYYTFHDSFKILPQSLRKLSESFEVENGKLDLWDEVQEIYPGEYKNVVDFLDRCHVDDELFLRYLGYDVISLYEVLEKFRNLLGLSLSDFVKSLSTASISRAIFKNGYKGKEFRTADCNKSDYEIMCSFKWYGAKIDGYDWQEVENVLRDSYLGGRCEVFKPRLTIQGYHYDINSMYPAQFYKDYPVGKPEMEEGIFAKEIFESWLQNHNGLGVIQARVFIPFQHIPPLPVRMGKLVFPCGEIVGTWTYNELEYAMLYCDVEVLEVFKVVHFRKTFPVFHNFVETFYKMKQDADRDGHEALRTLAKLMLNVAYGYTGMRRDDKSELQPIEKAEKYKGRILETDEILGFIEVESEVKSEYIQVQIATYVTSYARIFLLDSIRKAEAQGVEVYYCDTDSMVTDKPLPDEIVDERALGLWKCENKPISGIFLRPKVYAEQIEKNETIKTDKKFKGVSRETISEFNYDTYEFLYKELCELKHDAVVVEKNKTMLNSLIVLQKNNLDYSHYELRDKKMNLKTTEKREINYKNNWTKPLFFQTLEEFQNYSFKTKPANFEVDLTQVREGER